MKQQTEQLYVIPNRYRKMENLHIVFWLLKDIGWCLGLKLLGIVMIVPTLSVAIIIAWRTRKLVSELAHNLAIAFWITANSYWMISEFFAFDTAHIWNGYEGKHLALIPFFIGVIILAWYYIFQRPKEINENHPVTL